MKKYIQMSLILALALVCANNIDAMFDVEEMHDLVYSDQPKRKPASTSEQIQTSGDKPLQKAPPSLSSSPPPYSHQPVSSPSLF